MNIYKNKKIAIIGASYLQQPLVEKAKEMGLYVICFAWEKGAVCKNIVDKFFPISIIDKDEICAVCKREKIDAICTIASDIASITVSYVANKLELNANEYEVAINSNNKFNSRKIFMQNNILCPDFFEVSDEVVSKRQILNFPLIVKPVDRSGSLGVQIVSNKEQLYNAIKQANEFSFSNQVIVEEYIDSDLEVSVEFISFKGKHYFLSITDKITSGKPEFVEIEHKEPSALPLIVQNEIIDTTIQALNALKISDGASHTEFKINKDNKLYIIEVGARMGGDFIGSHLVYNSTGYDFVKGVIEVAFNQFTKPVIFTNHESGVVFESESNKEEFISIYKAFKKQNLIVESKFDINEFKQAIHSSSDRNNYFIYKKEIE